VNTKASIPANGSGATRLLAGELFVELHLLLGSLVLLLGLLLGLNHVLQVLLLLLLGLLLVLLLLVLLILFFLLLDQVGCRRPTAARRRPVRSVRSGLAVAAGSR
jgi:hypothetical protein